MDRPDLYSTRAVSEEEQPVSQLPESDSAKKKTRPILKVVLFIGVVCIVGIATALGSRFLLPTRSGWELIPLKEDNVFVQNALIWMTGRTYAQKPLVEALAEAGTILQRRSPGACIGYLDASGRKGGRLLGHLSHKYGRDVDILYIGRDKAKRLYPRRPQLLTVGYLLNYGQDGRCGSLAFDRKANLHLMLALLEQRAAPVEKIFVELYIRSWIIEEANKNNIPGPAMARLKQALRYAGKNAAKHDDHLHVRFSLPQKG